MKILVTFKRVLDSDSSSSPAPNENGKWMINYFDEIAIEEALRIKESGTADEVVGVTVSPQGGEEQIRSALAMGIDRAIRVEANMWLDPYAVARILAVVVQREKPDVVIMGKQAVDDDASQVGPMLAGLLGWTQATFISKVAISNDATTAECTRETDGGLEVIGVTLPAVITVDLRLNEPRYVSMPGLMKARRKPIEVITCEELGVDVQTKTILLSEAPAPRRAAGVRVESVEDLVARLRKHDKVV